MISTNLLKSIMSHEGLKLKPYRCPSGYLTIGYGRNLEQKGLSEKEALFLLTNDILECQNECEKNFKFFKTLNPTRQDVLVEMCYNLGLQGLKGFKKFLNAVEVNDFATASTEMLNSKWARQVKKRAITLAQLMKEGDYPLIKKENKR